MKSLYDEDIKNRHKRSEELYKEAKSKMPGGVNSPVRAFKNVGMSPLFIDHAAGDKIYDVDGNEYIDFIGSWGPNILGAANPKVVKAVKSAVDKGLSFGACHYGEIVLAGYIKEDNPSCELVRLVNSGTEACMSAIRTARGYTHRNKIIKFDGNYHGHSDCLLVKGGSGVMTFDDSINSGKGLTGSAVPGSAGVPESIIKETLTARYNDLSSVEKLFHEYGDDIACIIVEPVAANMGVVPPKPEFLKGLREITNQYGTILIFDEVITGYRLALGGAEEYFGIKPDMKCLGKIIGGGMPLAAYGGRADIMETVSPDGPVYQAGTLSGNPLAAAAGIATIQQLRADKDFYGKLNSKAYVLETAFRHAGINVNREGSILTPFFNERPVIDYETSAASDTAKYADYFKYMLKNGIYAAPSQFEAMFVSAAHSDADIEKTAELILEYK
ncbi:MAG: glutamate-1-semialdehyde 2,1-aminomutase [Lachnospiraceae bacterium]|jgi:glutamate-1-semialdehyde 2,1-aminomutase|nr:glutamate-1-semialdehyde 2,1-aminomutase [Lachnospiraceae bacterium]MEE3460541.1 glutamate-1-semialdehyde 2,1-aminomutase [Lachnospiraceae bacterium]